MIGVLFKALLTKQSMRAPTLMEKVGNTCLLILK